MLLVVIYGVRREIALALLTLYKYHMFLCDLQASFRIDGKIPKSSIFIGLIITIVNKNCNARLYFKHKIAGLICTLD